MALEHHVDSLRPREIGPYLEHRIEAAGGRFEQLFSPGSESVFYEFSDGCPRLVNLLGDRVLLAAYSQNVRPVPLALLEQRAKEMMAARSAPAAEPSDQVD